MLVFYPGDRGLEAVEEDDSELAYLYLKEGLSKMEIIQMFRNVGVSLAQSCRIYFAGLHLHKMRFHQPDYKLKNNANW